MNDASVRSSTANRLGALALALTDALDEAVTAATGRPASDSAALVALTTTVAGPSQESLARVLGLTQSGAVRLVDRLVAEGLAERRPGPDRRTLAVVPTARGKRTARAALTARQAALERLVGTLGARDAGRLDALLDPLLAAVTPDPDAGRRLCRLCDIVTCGSPEGRCPVRRAADAAASATRTGGARRGSP